MVPASQGEGLKRSRLAQTMALVWNIARVRVGTRLHYALMPAHGEDEVVAGAGKQMGDDHFLIWVLLSKCVWMGTSFEEDRKVLGGEPECASRLFASPDGFSQQS